MRRFLLLSVAALVTAEFSVSAAPASATTWHHKWSYLHFPARLDDGGYMPWRTLTLNGTYRWRMFVAHRAHQDQPRVKSRTVRLHGRYRWGDALLARQGTYQQSSHLRNVRTGGMVYLGGQAVLGSFGDGNYHWGSTLDNVRASR
jgi:hypothetical protein